jgi:hypothetical protein
VVRLLAEPSPPLNPQWSLQAPSVVQLNWQPPAHKNGIIVSYLILYRKNLVEFSPTWESKLENGTSTTATIGDLETDTIYLFKLRAVTGRGAGNDSQIITVYTKSGSAPGPLHGKLANGFNVRGDIQ